MNKEIWKDISGYEGLYQVSNLGRVKRLEWKRFSLGKWQTIKEKILKQTISTTGYWHISLNKNGKHYTYKVHRLVAEAFIPNPDNLPCINHKDNNPLNNNVKNLEWCTYKYNNNYGNHNEKLRQSRLGKKASEEAKQKMRNASPKRLSVQCIETKTIYKSINEASRKTGIDASSISKACKGKNKTAGGYHWKYI